MAHYQVQGSSKRPELLEAFSRVPDDLAERIDRITVHDDGTVRVRAGRKELKLTPEPWHRERPAVAAEQMWETLREDERNHQLAEGAWLFSFGYGHTHPDTGESLSDKAVRFGGTYEEARAKMVERFGVKWAFQYAAEAGPEGEIVDWKGEY